MALRPTLRAERYSSSRAAASPILQQFATKRVCICPLEHLGLHRVFNLKNGQPVMPFAVHTAMAFTLVGSFIPDLE
jgi:hypothetical protein